MQVFEFHFNPKLKPDLVFDSFCYEPKNIYEKRMGSLYLVGLLKNVLPQNVHFLDKLAKVIQKEYYRTIARKPEKALKEGLKEANEFLEKEAKKGDVSWLGNLSFAVLSLTPPQKFGGRQLNFSKIGDLKIFLLRERGIVDISQKLKFEEIAPWPLKIFGKIVSGKLAENDLLLISTKEVTDFFEREDLVKEIGEIWPPDEKEIKKIFDKRREEVLKISGLCLIILLTREMVVGKKEVISPRSYPKEFNLKEVFSPLVSVFKNLIKKSHLYLLSFARQTKLKRFPKPKLLRLTFPKFALPEFPKLSKNLVLILVLIFLLILGSFISRLQEEKELKEGQIALGKIQEKVNRAESFLILNTPQAEKEANSLLKESWEEVSQLTKIISHLPRDFQNQVFSLKDEISKRLLRLNKLETIEEPELFFDFSAQKPAPYRAEGSGPDFFPQKMIFFDDQLYFFSPYLENLYIVNKDGRGHLLEIDKKFNRAALLDEAILFFSKPNQLLILKKQELKGHPTEGSESDGHQLVSFSLKEPYPDFDFDNLSVFRRHLYFLDKKFGEIIRYPFLQDHKWGPGQLWLDRKEKKVVEAKSLAVDGSIWLLIYPKKNGQGSLNRYYAGQFKEKIALKIFPEPREVKKIFTAATFPYLYLLEPGQRRIIILDKKGGIIRQFQSQKFDNLLDFAVSQDAQTIYLLNGLKVYQINFNLP